MGSRHGWVWVLLAGWACTAERKAEAPQGLPQVAPTTVVGAPPSRAAVSPQTALWVLALRPDGTTHLDTVSVKPSPFRGPVHTQPMQLRADPASPPHLAGGEHIPSPHTHGAAFLLKVTHPDRPMPLYVDLALGEPGQAGGDVMDAWSTGSVVVRAPCFGVGTHYSVLKVTPHGVVEQTQGTVTP